MQIAADTPRTERTINGVKVQVPQPYGEGYTLNAGEAAMLNQTFAENVGNNLRTKIVGEDGKTPIADPQALVDEYVTSYEPGVRRSGGGGGTALTPLDREVRNLASEKLKELLRGKGLKQKDVNFTELRDALIEKHGDALRTQAEKVLKAKQKAAESAGDDLFADLDLSGGADEQQAEAA